MADTMTVTEARQQLSIVNAAIDEYLKGTRRKSLKIGTHEFMRAYDYAEISYQELENKRRELLQFLAANDITITPTFRQNCNFPLIVTRNPE